MAVYKEDENGNLTCVKADLSVNDVVRQKNAMLEAAGQEVSPCMKDTLAADVAGTTETAAEEV